MIACAAAPEKKLHRDGSRNIYNAEIAAFVVTPSSYWTKRRWTSWKVRSTLSPITVSYCPQEWFTTAACRTLVWWTLLQLVTGPNSFLPLIQVQAIFRTLPNVVVLDYTKAHNTDHTYPEEMHMRRLVWHNKSDDEWKFYVIYHMHFGDKY